MFSSSFRSILVIGFSLFIGIRSFDFDELLENVPESEQFEFLRYHLQRGYSINKRFGANESEHIGKDIISPGDLLCLKVYAYVIDNFNIILEENALACNSCVCFDNGQCIDLGDVGIHP
ncbi:uncharacterized protein LOC108737129 isoform X2 [Agrilus planipennis]|uniref:Uncharacterized protein LOC108737129 isoform X2 n=1 Tax=Agrilus planipennis TaxID=224129 RepID=A0A1W4WXS4_AGRPL|nr:uncharacterized protein LOC108737129 isoform X2 [Agrilus planipennis]